MATAAREAIAEGQTSLGVELGSTRIKTVLIGPDHEVLASGSHAWENQLVDGLWTYAESEIWSGLQASVGALLADVGDRHGIPLKQVGALGVSAMMHGYLAMGMAGDLLVPFRTWRNTNTGPAVDQLSEALNFSIPHRWSVAHLLQAVLDDETHLAQVDSITTLAGYVHRRLTGQRVLGIGDASGMFPIDSATGDYDAGRMTTADRLLAAAGFARPLRDLLPQVLGAGQQAGHLTEDGAALLDPSGSLRGGAPMCPPEGDAGTGMVATNSVAPRTGNTSAGTSIFAMVVLERPLSQLHHELDMVTTPAGAPVAMVHCNNGASELGAWASLFGQFATALGHPTDPSKVFGVLFHAAQRGAVDGGGMLAWNYLAGEPITGLEHGRPLFMRTPGLPFELSTFMRTQLYSAFATLRVGMDVLAAEGVQLDRMFAHGGLFMTEGVAQGLLAAALGTPVAVGDVAAEGGAWGIAVLARLAADERSVDLVSYLRDEVFADAAVVTAPVDPAEVAGFDAFMSRWTAALPVQRAAVQYGSG